jgi:Fic family protein
MSGDSERSHGQHVEIEWQGRKVAAWVPAKLQTSNDDNPFLPLNENTIRKTEQAANLSMQASADLPVGWLPMARLLARSEGIASSLFEGIRSPLIDVATAAAELGGTKAAVAVAENIAALANAMIRRSQRFSLTMLHDWHRILMAHATHLPDSMIGSFRTEQGWIGGASPFDAALVTTPPDLLDDLMFDLERFIQNDNVDPVTQAAVAHAQFETIHPYGDGNGRVGRVLVSWILAQRLDLNVSPPFSMQFSRDRGGYLSGLVLYQQGQVDNWVRWFATTVAKAAASSIDITAKIRELLHTWDERLVDVRSDAVARRALVLFPERFVVRAQDISSAHSVSDRAARSALAQLHLRGIIEPIVAPVTTTGRPPKLWVAPELARIMSAW